MYHMSSLNTDKTETCQGLRFKVSFNRLKQVLIEFGQTSGHVILLLPSYLEK